MKAAVGTEVSESVCHCSCWWAEAWPLKGGHKAGRTPVGRREKTWASALHPSHPTKTGQIREPATQHLFLPPTSATKGVPLAKPKTEGNWVWCGALIKHWSHQPPPWRCRFNWPGEYPGLRPSFKSSSGDSKVQTELSSPGLQGPGKEGLPGRRSSHYRRSPCRSAGLPPHRGLSCCLFPGPFNRRLSWNPVLRYLLSEQKTAESHWGNEYFWEDPNCQQKSRQSNKWKCCQENTRQGERLRQTDETDMPGAWLLMPQTEQSGSTKKIFLDLHHLPRIVTSKMQGRNMMISSRVAAQELWLKPEKGIPGFESTFRSRLGSPLPLGWIHIQFVPLTTKHCRLGSPYLLHFSGTENRRCWDKTSILSLAETNTGVQDCKGPVLFKSNHLYSWKKC